MPFASAIASSSESYAVTVQSGPKTSSHATFASAGASAIDRRPQELAVERRRRRGRARRASVASSIHSRTRSRSLVAMSGPTSVASSAGSPTTSASTRGRKRSRKASYAVPLDVDPLHRDAALTGERERVRGESGRGVVEVGVGRDDHRRRVAELEVHALARRALAELPADAGRAGERDERDALVLDEHVADLGRRPADDVEPAGRQARLGLELGEEERGERRLRRRLEHDRAAGRERRRDLVRDEVEREVERRDRADDADRHAQRERELPDPGRGCVHRDDVAGELPRLDGGHRERRRRARGLDARRLHRLARLGRDRPRDLLRALLDEARGAIEDRRALVRGQRLAIARSAASTARARLGRATLRDAADERAVVRRANLEPVAGLDPLAVDEELPLDRGRRHARECRCAARSRSGALALCSSAMAGPRTSSTPSARRSGGGTARSPRSAPTSSPRRC